MFHENFPFLLDILLLYRYNREKGVTKVTYHEENQQNEKIF